MAHTRKTLLLDGAWDLCLDGAGQIAVSTGDYATAQNVANECRLFTQDAYFAQDRGIPYFLIALGQKRISPAVLRARLRSAALLVEDVAQVTAISLGDMDSTPRELAGVITLTSKGGTRVAVEL